MYRSYFYRTVATCLLILLAYISSAQLYWPKDQLLPSFPDAASTQDLIVLQDSRNSDPKELYLFASLKGIVNYKQPRIFSYEGNNAAAEKYKWLESLSLKWKEPTDKWDLIVKYRKELAGLIVYDPEQLHTINLATFMAREKKALLASPELVARLSAAPYHLPVLVDLRGQFRNKLEVYQKLYEEYWPRANRRVLISISPERVKAAFREYAVAIGAPTIWLNPDSAAESVMLNKFLSSMPENGVIMGWWPEEAPGITRASQYHLATIASDYSRNLTVYSGSREKINIKPAPPRPALQNKIYVAFIISDGDNLQYVENLFRKLWDNPDRGKVPIGWTLSPAMVDAMPGVLNYYYRTATNNDNLISGPSGYGYIYPNMLPDKKRLEQFVSITEKYNKKAGFQVLTIWNTITGGIDPGVGEVFASKAPSLLGLTAQNTAGPLSIYNNQLPGFPLSCNYCTNEKAIKEHIEKASRGWNKNEPRFIIIQAQPWQGVTPTSFKNVMDSLGAEYEVVRPDHLFQLLRESKGLPNLPHSNSVK